MVEIAMIAANRAAAQFVFDAYGVGAFRNHQEPDWSRGPDTLAKLGWEGELPPKKDAKAWWKNAFEKFAGTPGAWLLAKGWAEIQTKAQYETENQGHHALAAEAYTHFTSPIRRYADLHVHRAIKKAIHADALDKASWMEIVEMCNQGSKRAKSAERSTRQHWMNLWWSQQPKDYEVKAVVKSVRKDGSAMVNTMAYGTSGLVEANGEEWTLGQDVIVKYKKTQGSLVVFTGAPAPAKEEKNVSAPKMG
jgi:ribonuclease R